MILVAFVEALPVASLLFFSCLYNASIVRKEGKVVVVSRRFYSAMLCMYVDDCSADERIATVIRDRLLQQL